MIKYYTPNENNRDEKGDLNNFPQYTSANKNLCNREKSLLWEQVDAYEAAGDDDMVKYLKSAISQWDEKLKA